MNVLLCEPLKLYFHTQGMVLNQGVFNPVVALRKYMVRVILNDHIRVTQSTSKLGISKYA